jgi:hypothetical protein
MTAVRHEHRDITVACDLDSAGIETRVGEWQALRDAQGRGAETILHDARCGSLGVSSIAAFLIEREAQCCGFLDFEMVRDADRVRLEITSPRRR